ncbi:MAG: hypothetical protein KDC79_15765 [Cyclobacteriaceae bacterium]|nr:hypothetical protein [Cyclobacteriaceae bacterium]
MEISRLLRGGFFIICFFYLPKLTLGQDTKLIGTSSVSSGTIFSVDPSGLLNEKWFDFSFGQVPQNMRLLQNNDKLWGTTAYGGYYGKGVIFTVDLNGENLTTIFNFSGDDGSNPFGGLIESNGKLWGMTSEGGSNDYGVIFTIEKDGNGFTVVHNFVSSSGKYPMGDLIESSGKLWGTTRSGGIYNYGTIFIIDKGGSNYTKVYDFDYTNGRYPQTTLVESNGKLWGMTSEGGASNYGVIFTIEFDGGGYNKIHDFTSSNGKFPKGNLVESNGRLWGLTVNGGDNDFGVIFSIDLDGANFIKIYDFEGSEGSFPYGQLLESNGKLWGNSSYGGLSNKGVIFNIDVDGNNYTKVHDFDNTNGANPIGGLKEINGKIWGSTSRGGTTGNGIIYNIESNGTNFNKLRDFDNIIGHTLYGGVIQSNGKLWGMTRYGGINGYGVIFTMEVDGVNLTKVHDFNFEEGAYPYGNLVENSGKLWGLTWLGGKNSVGVIFSINLDGTGFSVVHNFDEGGGDSPLGSLIAHNGKLWGMTQKGGINDKGVVFNLTLDSNEFNVVHHFDGMNGANPEGCLVESKGILWGTTNGGGLDGYGTIFKIDPDEEIFTKVFDFNNANGRIPVGKMIESKGKIWGMTQAGGDNYLGTIFNYDLNDDDFEMVYSFNTTDGGDPQGSLIESNGKLWGMTAYGGASNTGTIFNIALDGSGFTKVLDFTSEIGGRPKYGSLLQIGNKYSQIINFNLSDKIYGDQFTLVANSNSGIPIIYTSSNIEIINIVGDQAYVNGVGEVTITAFQPEVENYYAGEASQTIYVDKASLIATVDDKTITYGSEEPIYTFSYLGFVNGDSPSEIDLAPTGFLDTSVENAGTYIIQVNEGSDDHYYMTYFEGTLYVNKTSLIVSADSKAITYGDVEPDYTYSYSGFVNGEDESVLDTVPTGVFSVTPVGDAGVYTLQVTKDGVDNNYEFEYADGILTVDKASQTIIFNALDNINDENETVTLDASSSSSLEVTFFVSGPTALIGNTLTITGAGSVSVTASQPGNQNYLAAEDVIQSFCVNPVPGIVLTLGGQSTTLASTYSNGNQWFLNDEAIEGATEAMYEAMESGSYKTEVTIDGCSGISEPVDILVTGVYAEFEDKELKVYPVPAKDMLKLKFSTMSSGIYELRFVDINGKIWKAESIEISNSLNLVFSMNLSSLPLGAYTLLVIGNKRTIAKRIVKY